MFAIRLTRANLNAITVRSPIDRQELERMIDEYDTLVKDAALYFVPRHDLAHDSDVSTWMTVPRKALEELYKFDDSKIDTEFVEITRK